MLISNRALQLFLVFVVTLVLFSLQQPVLFIVAVFFLLVVNINGFINFQLSRMYIFWALFLTLLIMPSFFDVAHGFSSLFYFFGTIVCLLSAKYTAERYSLHDIYAAVRLLFV